MILNYALAFTALDSRIKQEVRVDPARGFLETPRIDHPTIKISKEIKTIKRKMTSLCILL